MYALRVHDEGGTRMQIKYTNFTIRCVVMKQFYLSQDNGPSSLVVLSSVIYCANPETFSALETSARNKTTHNGTPASGSFNEMTITNSQLASPPEKPF